MRITLHTVTGLVLGGGMALASACGGSNTDAADNTSLEPSRETRISDLAKTACDRYESCNGYGTGNGQTYPSEAECRSDFTSKAGALWPVDKCANGQINNSRYEACTSAAKDVACTGNILDAVSALDDCKASTVCIDPAM